MKKIDDSKNVEKIIPPSFSGKSKKSKINLIEYPIISEEDTDLLQELMSHHPDIFQSGSSSIEEEMSLTKHAWIQTYSGRKFYPLEPVEEAIVIQDIAHALSMLCRFTGHVQNFYSVAQHSVLVSYLCDSADALHGLFHDASEAYLQDLPRPLKASGQFENYKEYENILQKMIYRRFGLSEEEPLSVKMADSLMLATEARDLMSPLHPEWKQFITAVPLQIIPLNPAEAKELFMKRFFELKGCPEQYEHYLRYDSIK